MKTRVALALVVSLWPVLPWVEATAVASGESGEAEELGVKQPPNAILGEWLSEDKDGRIKFIPAGDGTYLGVVTWAAEPVKDTKNPDPKLRDRLTLNIVIIWNLRYEDGQYVGGYCYNPRDGNTYRMKTEVVSPDTMKVRGYLAIPLLGQTQEWTRYH